MDGWMDGWMARWVDDGWMDDGWIDGWMDGWMDGQMDGAETVRSHFRGSKKLHYHSPLCLSTEKNSVRGKVIY